MRQFLLQAILCLLLSTCARATVLFYSDGSDIGGFTGTSGNGGTATAETPFLINGDSQGSYLSATAYPRTDFTTPINAADPGDQELWVAFLMRRDSGNSWAGGITLYEDALPTQSNAAGVVGWNTATGVIRIYDGGEANPSASGFPLASADTAALLACFYESGGSGLFDHADLYVDGDLGDGIDFSTTLVTGYVIDNGANAVIGALRLGADPAGAGETRSYDNIVVATTRAEAVAPIPEPSAALLGSLGGFLVLLLRRHNGS